MRLAKMAAGKQTFAADGPDPTFVSIDSGQRLASSSTYIPVRQVECRVVIACIDQRRYSIASTEARSVVLRVAGANPMALSNEVIK
jgi:hypothetical protein